MPRRPPKPCANPGCPNVTHERFCPDHAKQEQRRYDRQRGSPSKRGYGARHRRWRALILERDPWCKACGREPSTVADHIVPIARGGARFDLNNGQGMCEPCHNRKTAKEDGRWG